MKAPAIARVYGILFLFSAVLALVPLVTPAAPLSAPWVTLETGYGFLFGLFPVNASLDAVHLILGAWGLFASFGFKDSVRYLRVMTWFYLLLALLGIVPITNTLFGIAPLYGHDIWLHVILAALASFGGYGAASIPPEEVPFVA